MKIIRFNLKEVATMTRAQFREHSCHGAPVIIVVFYATFPACTLFVAPPFGYLWALKPLKKLLPFDPFDELLSDAQINRVVESELAMAGVHSLPEGVFSLADDSGNTHEPGIGPWYMRVNIKPGDIERAVEFIEKWWDGFYFDAFLEIPESDAAVDEWWQEECNKFESSHIGLLLKNVWWPNKKRDQCPLKKLPLFFDEVFSNFMDEKNIFPRRHELIGISPGGVMRDAVIFSYMPNKKFEKQPDEKELIPEISFRDELFSMQARLVNLLDRLSMYWATVDAIKKYECSLIKLPVQGNPRFNALDELRNYKNRMIKRYPILASINT